MAINEKPEYLEEGFLPNSAHKAAKGIPVP
jgi:hypothetical protein